VAAAAAVKRIAIEIAAAPQVVALAHPAALEEVLVNLLDNAVKYCPESSRVRVAARAQGARVRIEVIDDGPGIDRRHRDRVFERFYRVDPGRSREMGGTGLGLSIVKHLVEAMAGTVGADAAHPHGAVFWLELPAAEPGPAREAPPAADA
jgi:two-component system phosphate regulon sensor histidine kinase PhoR